ncbi:hypothetical protein CCC_01810 [Paramagnetospirillum magnetotacticum MS-1]|uniref:DUF3124 domain-containing protein n=1 Tax=Paramagnetospirillum magnetotacticum MS-1 TaxID=272627 RepID=A0A0C2U6D4_PARME|nr:DUF3124 domain-containing protein [Paramagnetospirillum magnetotacticum]KIL97017.1 hypothetical protein CCC_01810 [Paramagnetospirillum magnetotacticum MS-1]
MRSALKAALMAAAILGPQMAWAEPLSSGQTLYVPVYSHISHGNLDGRGKASELLLSSMLSLRNTDPSHAITITAARYYDTDGRLLRDYLAKPLSLPPMGSSELFVEYKDTAGGSGANFVVEWKSDRPVNPPLIETVNAYFFGTQSVAFTSPGRPISPNP